MPGPRSAAEFGTSICGAVTRSSRCNRATMTPPAAPTNSSSTIVSSTARPRPRRRRRPGVRPRFLPGGPTAGSCPVGAAKVGSAMARPRPRGRRCVGSCAPPATVAWLGTVGGSSTGGAGSETCPRATVGGGSGRPTTGTSWVDESGATLARATTGGGPGGTTGTRADTDSVAGCPITGPAGGTTTAAGGYGGPAGGIGTAGGTGTAGGPGTAIGSGLAGATGTAGGAGAAGAAAAGIAGAGAGITGPERASREPRAGSAEAWAGSAEPRAAPPARRPARRARPAGRRSDAGPAVAAGEPRRRLRRGRRRLRLVLAARPPRLLGRRGLARVDHAGRYVVQALRGEQAAGPDAVVPGAGDPRRRRGEIGREHREHPVAHQFLGPGLPAAQPHGVAARASCRRARP